jgi:hypothetical protein
MIRLVNITDKIQVILAAAVVTNQLPCFASWMDFTSSGAQEGRSLANTNGSNDVDFVLAPASSTYRCVDFISIFNADTVSATLTLKYDANGTDYIIWKGILASGEILTYSRSEGWKIQSGLNSVGYVINVMALTSSPADSQTVYFGTMPKVPVTVAATSKVYIPKSGRIKRVEIYCYSGTAGTAEAWSLYVRLNNSSDTLIATLSVSQSERIFSNANLNILVNAGDYFEIKGIQPLWATNPLTTIYGGYVYIE